jgi:hypothetical protein
MIQSRSVREWAAHRCLTLALALALTVIGAGSGIAGPSDPVGSSDQAKQGKGKRCAQGSLECVFCASFNRHGEALTHATREVGALPNGVVILYRCEDPEIVVHLQRYAFEKQKIRQQLAVDPGQLRVCEGCGALWDKLKGATFEVANSVHGVFTLITSSDPEAVRVLHKLASEETQGKGVRGSS